MNIVLLDERQTQSDVWKISSKRQLEHLHTHVDVKIGDTLKVGILQGKRYLTRQQFMCNPYMKKLCLKNWQLR